MQNRFVLVATLLLSGATFVSAVQAAVAYQVIKVESWDTLNMRAGPGVGQDAVAQLPHDATGIELLGDTQQVGKTHWVQISWQDKRGWVSKAYLGKQAAGSAKTAVAAALAESPAPSAKPPTSANAAKSPAEVAGASTDPVTATPQSAPAPTDQIVKKKQSGMWVLECGNRSPYWKVEVLPQWLRGTLGAHKTGMPIVHQRQQHGQYRNVALETEIRGRNKWNRLEIVLTYNKSCHSTLLNKRVAFSVQGKFNDDLIKGCCRSYQVK